MFGASKYLTNAHLVPCEVTKMFKSWNVGTDWRSVNITQASNPKIHCCIIIYDNILDAFTVGKDLICPTILALGVHSKAINLADYAELGRYPLFIDELVQSMKYIDYIKYANRTWNSDVPFYEGFASYYGKHQKIFFSALKRNIKHAFGEYLHKHISTELSISGKKDSILIEFSKGLSVWNLILI